MKNRQLVLFCGTIFFSFFVNESAQRYGQTNNNPPKVEIISPKNETTFSWDSWISYSIRVTDTEDGSSEYEEIPPKKVFLEVIYLPGNNKLIENSALKTAAAADAPGFAMMKSSTCFNCHLIKSKFTGPSFLDISRKYANNAANISTLAKKVIKGSSGVWTNTTMPPNPDLTEVQAKQMVQWIFKSAKDPNRNYFVGVDGNFKTISKPVNGKGAYILTASYTDN